MSVAYNGTRTAPDAIGALDAIARRQSVRRFLPDTVPMEIVETVLAAAARAPSGTNIQPWHVHAVVGDARDRLSQAVLDAARLGQRCDEYRYMPDALSGRHLARRRKLGYELYALYGIERGDMAARTGAMLRNFEFFGAPLGLFFTMDRYLYAGSWLDLGMFMQNVMLAALPFGLATCPQQAWCEYGAIVHDVLGIPDDQIVVSGMALGYPDPQAPENRLRSERAALGEYLTVHGR